MSGCSNTSNSSRSCSWPPWNLINLSPSLRLLTFNWIIQFNFYHQLYNLVLVLKLPIFRVLWMKILEELRVNYTEMCMRYGFYWNENWNQGFQYLISSLLGALMVPQKRTSKTELVRSWNELWIRKYSEKFCWVVYFDLDWYFCTIFIFRSVCKKM